jgi:hypothetical protein
MNASKKITVKISMLFPPFDKVPQPLFYSFDVFPFGQNPGERPQANPQDHNRHGLHSLHIVHPQSSLFSASRNLSAKKTAANARIR